MAAVIACTISTWAITEQQLASLLAHFLRSDVRAGVSMFLKVSSPEARRSMLDGAAKASLSDKNYELFSLVSRAIQPVRKRRNEYAHGLWGVSADLPHHLLWTPQEDAIMRFAEMQEAELNVDPRRFADLAKTHKSILVYSKQDLVDDGNRAQQANHCLVNLKLVLTRQGGPDGEALRKLLASPLVQKLGENRSRQTDQ